MSSQVPDPDENPTPDEIREIQRRARLAAGDSARQRLLDRTSPIQREFIELVGATTETGIYVLQNEVATAYITLQGESGFELNVEVAANRSMIVAQSLLDQILAVANQKAVTLAWRLGSRIVGQPRERDQIKWYEDNGFMSNGTTHLTYRPT